MRIVNDKCRFVRLVLGHNVRHLKLQPPRVRLSGCALDEVAPHGVAAGNRYPESMMAAVNR